MLTRLLIALETITFKLLVGDVCVFMWMAGNLDVRVRWCQALALLCGVRCNHLVSLAFLSGVGRSGDIRTSPRSTEKPPGLWGLKMRSLNWELGVSAVRWCECLVGAMLGGQGLCSQLLQAAFTKAQYWNDFLGVEQLSPLGVPRGPWQGWEHWVREGRCLQRVRDPQQQGG